MAKKAAKAAPKASGARPKGTAAPKGRPLSADGPKYNVLSIRGSAEWRDWLSRLSEHSRMSAADVIDRALIVYARQEGFTESAPKR